MKALKAFRRVHIPAGGSVRVTFPITRDVLTYYTRSNTRPAEPGLYELLVGPNSRDVQELDYRVR